MVLRVSHSGTEQEKEENIESFKENLLFSHGLSSGIQ